MAGFTFQPAKSTILTNPVSPGFNWKISSISRLKLRREKRAFCRFFQSYSHRTAVRTNRVLGMALFIEKIDFFVKELPIPRSNFQFEKIIP
jgi:hypothetical protein